MTKRTFIGLAGGSVLAAAATGYFFSDKHNATRKNIQRDNAPDKALQPDESYILYLASLAPSGHNTQPWFVQYLEPYHWIIGIDKSRWLPGVDPAHRETILSIGAFIQNLEYASTNLGYHCRLTILAGTNLDENIVEIQLTKALGKTTHVIDQIKLRRTVRSNFLSDVLKTEDSDYLLQDDIDFIHYLPNTSKEHQWLNEQTIEANRIQAYRNAAQIELSNWIRFTSKDAAKHLDGLTLASMEIEGIPGWYVRNFFGKEDVMKKSFREQSIAKVVKQVAESAGWLIITSKDNSVPALLEAGMRLERLWLKIRDKNIAIHPMTQILEEAETNQLLTHALGIQEPVQFLLRTGYLKTYPDPVSLRRPVAQFIRTP